MRDLRNPKWIIAKGFLFLMLGVLSVSLLLVENPSLKISVLLAIAVWSFCRFYYFSFHVLERYIDSDYRFSGLFSMMTFIVQRARGGRRL